MFKNIIHYKKNLAEVITRAEICRKATTPAHFRVYADVLPLREKLYKVPSLKDYNWDTQLEQFVDDYLEIQEKYHASRRDILDDSIPFADLFMGIGDYSAFIDGEIEFADDTSWSKPIIQDWSDLEKLKLNENNYWFKKVNQGIEAVLKRVATQDIPFTRGYYSPLDLAWALRGENIYIDFYQEPEQVHKLLDFCVNTTCRFAECHRQLIRKYYSHNLKIGTWFSGGNVIGLSEDIATNISPETYRKFGVPYTQKVIDYFGYGSIHCHTAALHNVPEICKIHNVINVWIVEDPNTEHAIDALERLIPQINGVTLDIASAKEAIEPHLSVMKGANLGIAPVVDSLEEANQYVELIRRHSKV